MKILFQIVVRQEKECELSPEIFRRILFPHKIYLFLFSIHHIRRKEFTLEAGKSIKVDITVGVTGDIVPGKYKALVRLDGMDNQEFDIVVEVVENKQKSKQVFKTKAAAKKVAAKRTAIKKVVKKGVTKRRNKK